MNYTFYLARILFLHPARSIAMKYRMQCAITIWIRLCRLEKGVCEGVGEEGLCPMRLGWDLCECVRVRLEGRRPWGPPAFIKQLQFQSPVWHICTR